MIEYTDQQFLYKAVPVDYDGGAKLKNIKGNTLAFNQLVNNGNFASTSGWQSINLASFTVSGNIGSFTASAQWGRISSTAFEMVNAHKYLVIATVKGTTDNYVDTGIGNKYLTTNNEWETVSFIVESTSTANRSINIGDRRSSGWTQVQVRNAMIVDLTLMGLTADQFKSYFPLPYYSYQSTLLPFKGTSIKTVGKNLLDLKYSRPYHVGGTYVDSGITSVYDNQTIKVSGTATATAFVNLTFYSNVSDAQDFTNLANKRVKMSAVELPSGTAISIQYFRSDGTYTGVGVSLSSSQLSGVFTMPSDAVGLRSYLQVNNGTTVDFTLKVMLTFADADNTFEPYKETFTDLPTLTYFPNGMKSAGNVYDELTESKAITRVGAYTITSFESKSGATANNLFSTNAIMNLIKKPSADSVLANIKSNYGEAVTMSYLWANDKVGVAINGNGTIYVGFGLNGSVTTLAQANTYVQSNPITVYYELETPTETDANAEIIYRFYQDGTEQILPVNGTTPTTAPIWCDIEYYNLTESETPYRKFWLVNGNGERWDLTEKELKSFLESPQGLGFQKTIDVTRYGERAYKNSESYNFPQVTGDVLFYDSANSTRYEKYNEFVRFLMEQPITLHYMIPVSYNSLIADTYSLECEVMSLTKTESKTDRILTSNIQMNGLGFYEGDEIEINGTANTLTINNKGDFPVGFEIELRGTYKNPYFTLEQNGELYGEAKFDDNANNFSSVFVNSKDGEQNVVLKQNNSIMPNPLAYQDLSISNGSIYVTFVKLAKGESTLTIGADSYTISGYTIRYTPIYRSV